MENQPYLLTELEELSSVFAPLKTTSRIKYTCFNVSNNYLIFGATSGGLYVFRREPCCFLQILPNKEGAVTHVSISPDEKFIAFSTVRGVICILEKTSHGAKHLVTATEHQNEEITCLQWNDSNNELFIGDNTGKVSIASVSVFPTKGMFQTPSFVLMQLDSRIVQMDFCSNMLLVSTLTKCYICDTKKEIFRQVGSKLRDGEYGACIFNTQINHELVEESEKSCSYDYLKLFCARPGSRIWECAIDGTVISTHHFKEALAVPPRKIYFIKDFSSQNVDLNNGKLTNGSCSDNEHSYENLAEQSFNFQKLYVLMSRFFYTFKTDGIYIFDPLKAVVVLWNNEITNIVDAKSANDVIYVWSGFSKMYALNVVPLEKLLVRFYFQKKFSELARLCLKFQSFLLTEASHSAKLHVLQDLDEKLNADENLKIYTDPLKPLIDIFKENAQKRKIQSAQKLKSGIYLVTRNDQKLLSLLDDKRLFSQNLLRPNHLNLKGRSHSVSPERFQNGGFQTGKQNGSSCSLPELFNEEAKKSDKPNGVVVNGRKEKDRKASPVSSDDTSNVSKLVEAVKSEPTRISIFNLLNAIVELKGSRDDLSAVKCLPFSEYFKEIEVSFISDLFHSSLKSKLLFDWLTQFHGDWVSRQVKNYPNILVKSHGTEALEVDYKLSRVLKIFSSLLREGEIVELIRETGINCYYYSLLQVLAAYEDTSLSSLSESTLNLDNVSSTPKLLNIVYFLINMGQSEKCSRFSQKINLTEMFYLMLKFEESPRNCGKSREMIELQSHTLFLSYLDKASNPIGLINDSSDTVENYIIDCLENINSTANSAGKSSCSCGFPLSVVQPSVALFPDVGHALVEKNWPKNSGKCLEICSRIPHLWKYLIFLRKNEDLASVLPLILQTGEIRELENRAEAVGDEVLEMCFKYLTNLKKGNCLNCNGPVRFEGRTVSWTEFGMLCIKLSSPEKTLELFRKYSEDISSKELSQTFYQGLIFSAIMEKQGRGLRKNVVDALSGKGEESSRVSAISEAVKGKLFAGKRDSQFTRPEKDSHHWGIKVNFKDNCPVCSLPLDTKVLICEAGLIAFKCSHAFHSACLPKADLKCLVCKKESPASE